ncbi:hypothetical protein ACXZ8Y_00245 [Streptococcus agalactiae]
MKMKKFFSLLMSGLALVVTSSTLVKKSAGDMCFKTELKDRHAGYSELSGYGGLIFTGGGRRA